MLIVSQNRTHLINFENSISIDCMPSSSGCRIRYTSLVTENTIGVYSSTQRAKEVLQSIIDANNKASGTSFKINDSEVFSTYRQNADFVFYMPLE